MEILGLEIRRKNSRNNWRLLRKEVKNLHRRIKKKDKITTDFVIELDEDMEQYHSHCIIKYNDVGNLYNNLNRFIGSNIWIPEDDGFRTVYVNQGLWGEVRAHPITDEVWFRSNYMNKKSKSQSESLI